MDLSNRPKTILEELDSLSATKFNRDRENVIESRANNIITSAINLINLIRESYDEDVAGDLERRLLNSIKGQDTLKFSRGIQRVKESKNENK
jgi:hypothetical protein